MIGIFLVCGVRFYRDGLVEVLRRFDQIRVLGTASNCSDASAQMERMEPDVILIDQAANGSLGLARALVGRCKVVVLGISGLPDDVIEWSRVGISGYVDVNSSISHLVTVIESSHRGEFLCPPHVVTRIVQQIGVLAASGTKTDDALDDLTAREREILGLIVRGLSNKAISKQLGVTLATTKNHVHNLLRKLHVNRRGEAAAAVRYVRN